MVSRAEDGRRSMDKFEEALESLQALRGAVAQVKCPRLHDLNRIVLSDPRFVTAPGGSAHHHDYEHGLVIHVYEVMQNVFSMTNYHPSDELITAVIWHDYMKVQNYEWLDGKIVKTEYGKLIYHVAGSAMAFHHEASGMLSVEVLERIEHMLLSHHGRKEWGSPVEPATAEALILHTADMMSSKGKNVIIEAR